MCLLPIKVNLKEDRGGRKGPLFPQIPQEVGPASESKRERECRDERPISFFSNSRFHFKPGSLRISVYPRFPRKGSEIGPGEVPATRSFIMCVPRGGGDHVLHLLPPVGSPVRCGFQSRSRSPLNEKAGVEKNVGQIWCCACGGAFFLSIAKPPPNFSKISSQTPNILEHRPDPCQV